MLFDSLSKEQLLDLHAQVRIMVADPCARSDQHRNLLTLNDKIEEEVCLRCSATTPADCIVPGPTLKRCKYACDPDAPSPIT